MTNKQKHMTIVLSLYFIVMLFLLIMAGHYASSVASIAAIGVAAWVSGYYCGSNFGNHLE